MNTTDPAGPLRAAAEAIRTAGVHDSPMRLAKAALAAAGFAEAERRLRAVQALVDAAARDAATFGRGGPGCVNLTTLRAALSGTYRAPESDYSEHLISMAGGDGDVHEAGAGGMAEVILEHRVTRTGRCSCGETLFDSSPERVAAHGAAALSHAGFGPVKEAAEVTEAQWQEAAEMVDYEMDFGEPNPVTVPRAYTEADLREAGAVALEEAAAGWSDWDALQAPEDWLRARAAAVRGEG